MEDVRWHGYDTRDIYAAQDDCLLAMRDGNPISADVLQRIPPHRASLLANIARKANTPLSKGTYDQLEAEAKTVGGDGKLGQWWLRDLKDKR